MRPDPQMDNPAVEDPDDLLIEGDVDIICGNVESGGDIRILGDVRQGYSVRAGGSVHVEGLVDSASITAGGDIEVEGGIIGVKDTSVAAGGKISANFAQNAVLKGGGDILINEISMYSHITSSGRVEVLGKGVLIGGVVKARGDVVAAQAGSEASVKTVIEVGLDPVVAEEMGRLEEVMESQQRKLDALLGEANFLIEKVAPGIEFGDDNLISNSVLVLDMMKKGGNDRPESFKGELRRLAMSFFNAANEKGKLLRSRRELQRLLHTRGEGEGAAITIKGEVYPGVEIAICGKRADIESVKEGVQFFLNHGRIEERPL